MKECTGHLSMHTNHHGPDGMKPYVKRPERDVDCPYCGARAGERCTTSSGVLMHHSHGIRYLMIRHGSDILKSQGNGPAK